MTVKDYLSLFAPNLAISDEELSNWENVALGLAKIDCLNEDLQNQALALLIAHLISERQSNESSGGINSGQIKRRREGDLEIEYGSVTTSGDYSGYPVQYRNSYFGRMYWDLAKKCTSGGIGLITRFTYGCPCTRH